MMLRLMINTKSQRSSRTLDAQLTRYSWHQRYALHFSLDSLMFIILLSVSQNIEQSNQIYSQTMRDQDTFTFQQMCVYFLLVLKILANVK